MKNSLLQKAPMSLLAALELKVSGDNPTEFGGLVVPSIDVVDNYLLDRVLMAGNTTPVVAPATTVTATVVMPSTQRWRIRSLAATLNVAAADAAIDKQVWIGFQDPAGFVGRVAQMESSLAFENATAATYFDRPFWLPPGWVVHVFGALASAPANDWSLTSRLMYERITE